METSPQKIYENYKKKILNKFSVIEQLISIIENVEKFEIREKGIEFLEKIAPEDEKIFYLMENLLISDSNEKIRNLSAKVIKGLFIEKAFEPMKFSLQHERSIKCLLTVVKTLGEINTRESKALLIEKLNKSENPRFKNVRNLESLSCKSLAEIVKSCIIADYLEKKYARVNYKLKNNLIIELDLSCVGNHVFNFSILRNVPDFISDLNTLKKLDLKINRLTTIPPSIQSLSLLSYLDLSYNKIKYLPKSIGSLISLKGFYLRHNNLENIPNSIGSLKSLKILDLRKNKLKNIPISIGNLSKLEVLDLHGNQLIELPDSIGELSSLKVIDLGLNYLRILPKNMKLLSSLEVLELGGNKYLKQLPNWINSFLSLKKLSLYDNNLKELPEFVGALKSLEEITLRNNHLTTLPESFSSLSSLKKLDLSWNNLTSLPKWISNFTSLEELNLWGNKLETIPESIKSLESLKNLTLNYNKLNNKTRISFKGLETRGIISW